MMAKAQSLSKRHLFLGDRCWDRYLDPRMLYLSEDGTRKSKADLLKEITPLPKGISGTITGFVDRREGRDIPWKRIR
jgi:hypothetical protein